MILICEADIPLRVWLYSVLGKFGYDVMCCENSEQALLMSAQYFGRIDLVITSVEALRAEVAPFIGQIRKKRPQLRMLLIADRLQSGDIRINLPEIDVMWMPVKDLDLDRRVQGAVYPDPCLAASAG